MSLTDIILENTAAKQCAEVSLARPTRCFATDVWLAGRSEVAS